jgi:hypothetical protein
MHTDTCCATTTQTCDGGVSERPRYFPRQIVTSDDLSLDQEYERTRRRLHNRMLHGWGVVCGARVCPVPLASSTAPAGCAFEPWKVTVSPGYVLGPYGDEILIDCCRTVDLRTPGTSVGTGAPSPEPQDPWCAPVFRPPKPGGPLYVAVRYRQLQARPVRVQPVGCGCDDTACESSRWRDGYDLGVLTSCPDSHQHPPYVNSDGVLELDLVVQGELPDCPECPPEGWVVLARVDLDADGCVEQIDNCACRRNVASFARFWWACQHAALAVVDLKPAASGVDLEKLAPSTKAIQAVVTFDRPLPKGASASLGQGITVVSLVPGSPATNATLTFKVNAGSTAGPRTLTVVDDGCAIATLSGKVAVVTPT